MVQTHPRWHALSQSLQGQLFDQVLRTAFVELAGQLNRVTVGSRKMALLACKNFPSRGLVFGNVAMASNAAFGFGCGGDLERTTTSGSDDEGHRLTFRQETFLLLHRTPNDTSPRFLLSPSVIYILESRHGLPD